MIPIDSTGSGDVTRRWLRRWLQVLGIFGFWLGIISEWCLREIIPFLWPKLFRLVKYVKYDNLPCILKTPVALVHWCTGWCTGANGWATVSCFSSGCIEVSSGTGFTNSQCANVQNQDMNLMAIAYHMLLTCCLSARHARAGHLKTLCRTFVFWYIWFLFTTTCFEDKETACFFGRAALFCAANTKWI